MAHWYYSVTNNPWSRHTYIALYGTLLFSSLKIISHYHCHLWYILTDYQLLYLLTFTQNCGNNSTWRTPNSWFTTKCQLKLQNSHCLLYNINSSIYNYYKYKFIDTTEHWLLITNDTIACVIIRIKLDSLVLG